MDKAPEEMTLAKLDVLVMPNGEILCLGKSLGYVTDKEGWDNKTLGSRLTDIRVAAV